MSKLFGTSGVRGIINEEITPRLAINLSRAFANELDGSGRISIGRDTRLSGKMIEDALTAGFLSTGMEVAKLGVVPTPVVGFSASKLGMGNGTMVTASHNPPQYNGIKFFDSSGRSLSPKRERKIEEIYLEGDFKTASWDKIPEVGSVEVLEDYLNYMKDKIHLENEYSIIVDCSNGPASKTTPKLLRELGCEVSTINSQLDGSFPGHPPEPTVENLRELSNLVEETDADLGMAHDGDGDRIAVVDERGQIVNGDKLLALVGSYSVKKFGGGIVTTVDASKIVEEQISEAGGMVSRTKVGDVSVAQEMDSRDFSFGGEPSGTWIVGDIHMCPDGTLAAARILEALESHEESLSQLMDSMPSYPLLRVRIKCPNREKAKRMKSAENQALSVFEEVEDILTVDGIRLEFENGDWVLIRPSGTEPYIRITAEANKKERAEYLIETSKRLVGKK